MKIPKEHGIALKLSRPNSTNQDDTRAHTILVASSLIMVRLKNWMTMCSHVTLASTMNTTWECEMQLNSLTS